MYDAVGALKVGLFYLGIVYFYAVAQMALVNLDRTPLQRLNSLILTDIGGCVVARIAMVADS